MHMNKTTLLLGTASGILLLLGTLLPGVGTDGSNANQGENLAYLMVLLSAVGAIVAMVLAARKNREIKFGRIILTGLATALVTTVVYYVGSVVYFKWIASPDFLENMGKAYTERKALDIPDAAKRAEYLASADKDLAIYSNPFLYPLIQAVLVFITCLMPVAVCGYIIFRINSRRKPVK